MASEEARRWLRGMKAVAEIEDCDPAALEEAVDRLSDDDKRRLAHAIGVAEKVAYVKSQPQTRNHTCHWPNCGKQVPPAMWGCREHWYALPKHLRDKIWRAYRPGQEKTLSPSREYLAVAHEVEAWIRATFDSSTEREPDRGSFERAARRARERDAERKTRGTATDRCADCRGRGSIDGFDCKCCDGLGVHHDSEPLCMSEERDVSPA